MAPHRLNAHVMLQECPVTSKLIQASIANASAPQSSGHLPWRRRCHAKPARNEHLSRPRCLWPIHIAASTASWISGAADQPISLPSTTASIRGVLFHHYISRLPPKVPTQKKMVAIIRVLPRPRMNSVPDPKTLPNCIPRPNMNAPTRTCVPRLSQRPSQGL